MEVLDSDNIFTDEEVGRMLGGITADTADEEQVQEEIQEEEDPVVENLEDEFSQYGSESVGNENEPPAQQQQPGSPTPNLFTSLAVALREEGVFPDLDDEALNQVVDARGLRELFEQRIQDGLSEQQRRISEALSAGVQPTEIQQYEGALAYLDQVTDEMLTAKNEQGEALRKRIIFQDLLNRGYSEQKAQKELRKSLTAGTDIEDARDSYIANKEYFQGRYNAILQDAKDRQELAKQDYNRRAEEFERSIMDNDRVFGNVDIDKATRRRVYDTIIKPVHRSQDGRYLTELQHAQLQDPDAFSRNVGLLYVLTDGFKNVDKLIKPEVSRQTSRGLANLENVLNNTRRNPDGSLNLMSGVKTDNESYFEDFELDV